MHALDRNAVGKLFELRLGDLPVGASNVAR
jgi:hypothetical protein